MPNNENNNFQNNFLQGDGQIPNTTLNPQQPIIEIPQTYYEKLEKEKSEELELLEANKVQQEDTNISKNLISLSILNALVTYAIFYLTVNKNELISAGILIYIAVLSIFFAIKDKKESSFPTSVLVGGMISAVVCFIISMLSEEMDLWTYYTTASALTGFIGLAVSSMITKLFTDFNNIKALQTIFYLLFFVALIYGPYMAYQKFPNEFYQIVFNRKKEVVAETYEEFVLKTLKNRYNVSFNCNFNEKEHYKTEKNELMVKMSCLDENNNSIAVRTIAYNEGSNQYTVIDDFIEVIYFTDIKSQLAQKVQSLTGASEVLVYLYPKENCTFLGDCVDCDEYYKSYEKENDSKNRYSVSSKLDLSKYKNLSDEEFIKQYINKNDYKILINIRGSFNKNTYDFNQSVQKILEELNNIGFMNNYGYEIEFNNYAEEKYEVNVYETKGKPTSTKRFE